MKSLTIIGRRWFKRGPGNTYYSALIVVDGKVVYRIPYAYGYGDTYEQDAANWLEKNGYLSGRQRMPNGSREPLWQYCSDRGIAFLSTCSEVKRKKDL